MLQGNVVSPTNLAQPLQQQQQQQMIRQVAQQLMSATGVAPVVQQPQLLRSVSPGAAIPTVMQQQSLPQQIIEGAIRAPAAFPQLSPLGVGDKRPVPAVAPMLIQQQPTLQQQQLMKLQEQRSIQQIQQQLMASAPPPLPQQPGLASPTGLALGAGGVISPASSPPVRKRLKMDSGASAAAQQQMLQQQEIAAGVVPLQQQRQSYGQVGNILMQTGTAALSHSMVGFVGQPSAAAAPSTVRPAGQRSPGGSSPSHSVNCDLIISRFAFLYIYLVNFPLR